VLAITPSKCIVWNPSHRSSQPWTFLARTFLTRPSHHSSRHLSHSSQQPRLSCASNILARRRHRTLRMNTRFGCQNRRMYSLTCACPATMCLLPCMLSIIMPRLLSIAVQATAMVGKAMNLTDVRCRICRLESTKLVLADGTALSAPITSTCTVKPSVLCRLRIIIILAVASMAILKRVLLPANARSIASTAVFI